MDVAQLLNQSLYDQGMSKGSIIFTCVRERQGISRKVREAFDDQGTSTFVQ